MRSFRGSGALNQSAGQSCSSDKRFSQTRGRGGALCFGKWLVLARPRAPVVRWRYVAPFFVLTEKLRPSVALVDLGERTVSGSPAREGSVPHLSQHTCVRSGGNARAAAPAHERARSHARGSERHEEQYSHKHPTHETNTRARPRRRAGPIQVHKRPIPPRVALHEDP